MGAAHIVTPATPGGDFTKRYIKVSPLVNPAMMAGFTGVPLGHALESTTRRAGGVWLRGVGLTLLAPVSPD